MKAFAQIESLMTNFARDVEFAKVLKSPNPEDDLAIKSAIVGFSYNSPTDDWGVGHYSFIRTHLDGEYSLRELETYGGHYENIQLFFALCAGFLLGLYQADKISDEEFRLGELQMPGLIAFHCGTLTKQAIV